MLKLIKHGVTFYSKLNFPSGRGLCEESIINEPEAVRKGDILELKITSTYSMTEPNASKKIEVLKSQTKYELETDGTINEKELYQVFHHAMTALISGLNQIEKEQGMTITTHLRPLSFEVLYQNLTQCVSYFLSQQGK